MKIDSNPLLLKVARNSQKKEFISFSSINTKPTVSDSELGSQSMILELDKKIRAYPKLTGKMNVIFLGLISLSKLPNSILTSVKRKFATYGLLNIVLICDRKFNKGIWEEIQEITNIECYNFFTENAIITYKKEGRNNFSNSKKVITQHIKLDKCLKDKVSFGLSNSISSYFHYSFKRNLDGLAIINNSLEAYCKNSYDEKHLYLLENITSATKVLLQSVFGYEPICDSVSIKSGHHSLLGCGLAIISVNNMLSFIKLRIGQSNFFEAATKPLSRIKSSEDLLALDKDDNFWKEEYLNYKDISNKGNVEPMFAYFDSSTGFQNIYNLIKIPKECLFECNSLKYNLHTITHELSHSFIKPVLQKFLKGKNRINKINEILNKDLSTHQFSISDLFATAIFDCMVEFAYLDNLGEFEKPNIDEIENIIRIYFSDFEEYFVHLFDYSYFYNSDSQLYVSNIWMSWSTIPSISDRVEEYLLRTICCVTSGNLKSKNPLELSITEIKRYLQSIYKESKLEPIKIAIKKLKRYENIESFRAKAVLLQNVAEMFRGIFYSESLASKILVDKWRNNRFSKDFDIGKKVLKPIPFENALTFVNYFCKDQTDDVNKSYWILYNLCFNWSILNA